MAQLLVYIFIIRSKIKCSFSRFHQEYAEMLNELEVANEDGKQGQKRFSEREKNVEEEEFRFDQAMQEEFRPLI